MRIAVCYRQGTVGERPDDLRRQLETLWRVAKDGLDSMREVVVRSSQSGRLRLDVALLQRERQQLLVELGERACRFIGRGGGPVPEAMRDLFDRIQDIDNRLAADASRQGEGDEVVEDEVAGAAAVNGEGEPPSVEETVAFASRQDEENEASSATDVNGGQPPKVKRKAGKKKTR